MSESELSLSDEDNYTIVCASNRAQPYRSIHKGLRVLLSAAMQQVGALDAVFDSERSQMVDVIEEALNVCCDHIAHEDRYFHEPLRELDAPEIVPFYVDHRHHLQTIAELRALLQGVRDAGAGGSSLAYQLYLQYTAFVAENLKHMIEEETVLTRVLWDHFTDDQILGFGAALRATFSPLESSFYLQLMSRGLNHSEVLNMLEEARAHAPDAVFRSIFQTVSEELSGDRLARLVRAMKTSGER